MIELRVNDMNCGHDVMSVACTIGSLDPTGKVEVDLGAKRVRIESVRPAAEQTQAQGQAGYPAMAAWGLAPKHRPEARK